MSRSPRLANAQRRTAAVARDWRDPANYRALRDAGRTAFAWEWLRRDPEYQQAALAGIPVHARRFGLVRFEPPELPAPDARPLFDSRIDPYVLRADARPGAGGDAIDFATYAPFLTHYRDGEGEHILVSNGRNGFRLDIRSGTAFQGSVELSYRICGIASAQPVALTLQRLLHLVRNGSFSSSLFPVEARAVRWIQALRVHDALADQATQREIAAALFGADTAGPRWRIESSSYRLRVQRLVALARRLAGQGPAFWFGDSSGPLMHR